MRYLSISHRFVRSPIFALIIGVLAFLNIAACGVGDVLRDDTTGVTGVTEQDKETQDDLIGARLVVLQVLESDPEATLVYLDLGTGQAAPEGAVVRSFALSEDTSALVTQEIEIAEGKLFTISAVATSGATYTIDQDGRITNSQP